MKGDECCKNILDTGSYVIEGKCFSSRDKLHYKPKYAFKEYQNLMKIRDVLNICASLGPSSVY